MVHTHDIQQLDKYGNLLTVCATLSNDWSKVTAAVNGRPVWHRNPRALSLEALRSSSEEMMRTLVRSGEI